MSILTPPRDHVTAAVLEVLESRRLLAAINSGEYVTGTLQAGQTAQYTFDAKAGQTVLLSLGEQTPVSSSADPSTPAYTLTDPNSTIVSQDSTFDGLTQLIPIATDGTYTLNVFDRDADSAMVYGVSIVAGDAPVDGGDDRSGPIDSGRYLTGTRQPAEIDVYTIRSRAGASLYATHAEVTPESNSADRSTPAVAIFAPDGTLLGSDSGFAGVDRLVENLPADGVYRVAVYDSGADSSIVTGVTIVAAPAAEQVDDGNNGGVLSDGASLEVTLDPAEVNVYTFAGAAGASLTLTVAEVTPVSNSADRSTPALRLLAPDGSVVEVDTGFASASITVQSLPLSGQYIALVSDANVDSATNLRISRIGGGAPFAQLDYFRDTLFVDGTSGDDVIYGQVRDVIVGGVAQQEILITRNGTDAAFPAQRTGRIEIQAGAGDDTVILGNSADAAVTGFSTLAVNSYVFGDTGDDTLTGGDGQDTLTGGSGRNRLFGGDGPDKLNGSGGRDFLRGEGGDDRLYGRGGSDDLSGGGGVDRLFGDELDDAVQGDDFLKGGGSNDKLYGRGGNDTLVGEGQNDLLFGGEGDDYLAGSAGDDTLDGQGGNDLLFGEAGNDILYSRDGVLDTLDGGTDNDTAEIDTDIDSVLNIESFI